MTKEKQKMASFSFPWRFAWSQFMYGFGLSTDHANLINKGKKKKKWKNIESSNWTSDIIG